MCHVTIYSTILGVFWQLCPGVFTLGDHHFESGENLGTSAELLHETYQEKHDFIIDKIVTSDGCIG